MPGDATRILVLPVPCCAVPGRDPVRSHGGTHGETTIALVTGANEGPGLTTARRAAERGRRVWTGTRDAERGKLAADEPAAAGLDVEAVELDVTDDASVAAAASRIEIEQDRLDVPVNNEPHVGTTETGPDEPAEVYGTNGFGPVRVTRDAAAAAS